jgi:prevent-host-death family protein
MKRISATEAGRRFSELLDAVEHESETFIISRRGRVVARIEPALGASGAALKRIMRRHPRDPRWATELAELRSALSVEERRWPA